MRNERLRRIESLFQEALELPPDERREFLSRNPDAELRREVESLLEAHREAGEFLETPVVQDGLDLLAASPASERREERVGPYRLLRKIGEGGMSEVYLAVRADDAYQKHVALKVIRHGMGREDVLRRFRIERQILASLDHPNIAKLLDGGSTEDGLPYFVMDYIEGVPIDDYCDRQRLSIPERLELFRTVCAAVQYAHQSLVVHRDIKASNILVTSEGVPKLLDFGIAKLLKPDQFPEEVEYTAPWLRPMTPPYASPEQVQGQLVTTASDVYSLGVLLYKLLAGRLPFDFDAHSPAELTRIILEEEAERPSAAIWRRTGGTESAPNAVSPRRSEAPPPSAEAKAIAAGRATQPQQLHRQLVGDLDNIVLMALRKEPQRRYASVEQLSEDIRRHLAGLPVVARHDTFGYRTAKFLRRNRVGVAVAAGFVALLIGFSVSMAIQAHRIARERDQARKERDRAERVVRFLEGIFQVSDPMEAGGENITAREILDRGAKRVSHELQGEPEVQATLMEAIGNVYRNLGLYDWAQPLLERALEVRRQQLGEDHPQVARSLNNLGLLLSIKGDYAAAAPLLRQAVEMRRRLLGADSPAVAESLNNLGKLLQGRGDYRQAEQCFRQAIQIQAAAGEHPDLATQQTNLAILLNEMGRYGEAEPLFRQALELRRSLLGEEHPLVAESLNNLGVFFGIQGDFSRAESLFREALGMRRKLLGSDHPDVGESLNNLGMLMQQRRDYAAAEALYREALEIETRRRGRVHPRVAVQMDNLADVLKGRGGVVEAESLYRQAMSIRRQVLGDGHPDVGDSLTSLGSLLVEVGRPGAAEALLREGLEVFESSLPPGHWRTAEAESHLGACLARLGKYAEAEPLLLHGYGVLEISRGAENRRSQEALERIVALYDSWGKPRLAAQYRARTGG